MINRNINPTLFNNIVNLLTPYMAEGDRDTLITPAFSGYPKIYGKIDQSGTAGTFTVRLIRLLARYGEIEPGVSALSHLLEAVCTDVGPDVQRDIGGLLQELKDQKSNSQLGKGRPLRVFLCHGSSDKAEVRNLYKRLKQDGMDPWLDEEKLMAGQQWQREIPRAVRQSDVVVVALSHNAVNAEGYIQNEIRFSLETANELSDETIYIIPLKLEACDVPEQLALWHWVDLFDERGYERLIKALQIRAQELNAQPPVWNSGEYKYVTKQKQQNPLPWTWLISSVLAILLVIWIVFDYLPGLSTTISSLTPSATFPMLQVVSIPVSTLTPTEVLKNTPLPSATDTPTVVPTSTPTVPTNTPTPGVGSTYVNPIDGATYLYVPAGEFIMGSTDKEADFALALCKTYYHTPDACRRSWFADEQPQHTVYLDSYWIMETEVTNAQYRKFMEATGYTVEAYWSKDGWSWRGEQTEPECWDNRNYSGDKQPVVCISWYEAEAYAKWLSMESGLDFGLPTEAQWEKAARGSDSRLFPWGDEWDGSRLNYCDKNCAQDWSDQTVNDGYPYTAPVGSYPSGLSPYKALDMTGNVWEWTADWYDSGYYSDSYSENPTGPENGSRRVVRGGSWSLNPNHVRAAVRDWRSPDNRDSRVGVRLWLSAPPD